jgi:hypothetical protein
MEGDISETLILNSALTRLIDQEMLAYLFAVKASNLTEWTSTGRKQTATQDSWKIQERRKHLILLRE